MTSEHHDLIIIGGGVGGSALAGAMAEAGANVLVVEAETQFRDRVRGEAIMPWGVAEAKALGLEETLAQAGANPLTYWDSYQGADRSGHRNLVTTTKAGEPVQACYHPDLQEALLRRAEGLGATVRRSARVTGLSQEQVPVVTAEFRGRASKLTARLVVGADGRGSPVRTWAGFEVKRDPEQILVAGVLLEGVSLSEDATHAWLNTSTGYFILNFPQGNGRTRAYLCYPAATEQRFSGRSDFPEMLGQSVTAGVPPDVYANAKPVGPLATFDGRSVWADRAYRNGVALIGDAAANTDPTWGQGLSMVLRDARVLRDQLLATEDWKQASEKYAESRQQYFGVVHTMENWQTQLLMETGPEADARRAKAFPTWREDRTRNPDTFLSGPGEPLDEAARRRFFGED